MKSTIKNFRNISFALITLAMMILTSCQKESPEITDIENLASVSIQKMHQGAIGKTACLEFIFPISVQFVDESVAEADSYDQLHEVVVEWFTENDVDKSKENRPQILFPIQVLNQDGEIIDLASKEELLELKKECPRSGECKGKKGRGFKCFSLVFPVTITIDGTDSSFDDKETLRAAIKAAKEELGDTFERPTLVYPVTVEYDDESQVIVENQEELKALKEACQES